MRPDLFDGFADLRRYERGAFAPHQCELVAFESYAKYTLTRMLFDGRDAFLYVIKGDIKVEHAPNGALAHYIHSEASLVLSVGGLSYIASGEPVKLVDSEDEIKCYAGFDDSGSLLLTPDGIIEAVNIGIMNGVEASPFLIVNGKRLAIKDEAKRSRDRLLIGQLRTGEPVFLFIKGVDVARAADYAYQLGCKVAAVIGNEKRIDIYGKGLAQDRQSGCKAVFIIS